jgi:GNAT superfamily N-acetyltransferase
MSYITVSLAAHHKKEHFSCGKDLLDKYLHKQAKQDVKKHVSVCFLLIDEDDNVKGYYTLSSTSISRDILPDAVIKKMPPSYTNLPATLLGRLAVDSSYMRQGIGEAILMDALKRSYDTSLSIGSMAVIVDPIDEEAVKFYKKYDFILIPDSGKMFISMDTISSIFK